MQASRVSRKGVLHCDDSESNNLRCFVIGFPQIVASFSGLSAPRRNEASGRIAAAPVSLPEMWRRRLVAFSRVPNWLHEPHSRERCDH